MNDFNEYYKLYLTCFPGYEVHKDNFIGHMTAKGARILSEYLTLDGETRLAGFALIVDNAVALLCVSPEQRQKGCGSRLLSSAEEIIRSAGYDTVNLGLYDDYLLQGLPEETGSVDFFKKRGYCADFTSVDMCLELRDFDETKLTINPLPAGINFGFATAEQRDELLAAVDDTESWWRPIFENTNDPVLLALEDGKIVGFEMVSPDGAIFLHQGARCGCIGCVGVVPSARKRGIGLRLVAHGAEYLKSIGCDMVELGYIALVGWYAKIGLKPFHHQWMGSKKLD